MMAGTVSWLGEVPALTPSPPMPAPSARPVYVVTPWWNHPEYVAGWVEALDAGPLRDGDYAVVVDNGSVEQPRIKHPRVVTMRLDGNYGFSKPSNLGFRWARQQAADATVVFLNNDVRATAPGWLDALREAVEPGRLVGALLRQEPHTMIEGHVHPYLDGWCIAGRILDFVRLDMGNGPWDEGYEEPAYWADNDLSFRALMKGLEIRQVPVPLLHLVNGTARGLRVEEVSARNRARFEQVVKDGLAATRRPVEATGEDGAGAA